MLHFAGVAVGNVFGHALHCKVLAYGAMPLVHGRGVGLALFRKADMHAVRHHVAAGNQNFYGLLHGRLGDTQGARNIYSVNGLLLFRKQQYALKIIFDGLVTFHHALLYARFSAVI